MNNDSLALYILFTLPFRLSVSKIGVRNFFYLGGWVSINREGRVWVWVGGVCEGVRKVPSF